MIHPSDDLKKVREALESFADEAVNHVRILDDPKAVGYDHCLCHQDYPCKFTKAKDAIPLLDSIQKEIDDAKEAERIIRIESSRDLREAQNQMQSLQKRLVELEAEGYGCGLLEGYNGVFVGGCGKHVDREQSYRCSDCTASFHRDCIRKHFEVDGMVKARREVQEEIMTYKKRLECADKMASILEDSRFQLKTMIEWAEYGELPNNLAIQIKRDKLSKINEALQSYHSLLGDKNE